MSYPAVIEGAEIVDADLALVVLKEVVWRCTPDAPGTYCDQGIRWYLLGPDGQGFYHCHKCYDARKALGLKCKKKNAKEFQGE